MSWVTEQFMATWRSGQHVAPRAPTAVVEVRRGNFYRDYYPWPQPYVNARIPGETRQQPFYPHFVDDTAWTEVPNVIDLTREKSLDANGCQVVTINVDNVGYVPLTGVAGDFHAIDRGYFTPWRTAGAVGVRPAPPWNETPWTDVLSKNANIRVWVGFGVPERDGDGQILEDGGSNGTWVFNGFVDKVDGDSDPARLQVVARMGKLLSDQHIFRWAKSQQLRDPVIFADRKRSLSAESLQVWGNGWSGTFFQGAALDAEAVDWILIDDISDMVRVCLRWAGYTEWEVEDTGVRLKDRRVFNRAQMLIDPIKWACEQTGFVFFIADPTSGSSWGVPTFRRPAHLLRDPEAIAVEVKDIDLATGLHVEEDEELLPTIIRVRGKEATAKQGGRTLSGDRVRRLMYVYRPPWAPERRLDTPDLDGLIGRHLQPIGDMAGIIKHVVTYETSFTTINDCKMAAMLTAANAGLLAYPATCEMPGLPLLELDDQVGVLDQATGTNSRVWVGQLTEKLVMDVNSPSWTTSIGGNLLDNALLAAVIRRILSADFGDTPSPVRTSSTRERRIR